MAGLTVFIGHDNPIDWVLTATSVDNAVTYINATDFDRFVVDLGDIEADSDVTGFGIDKVFDNSVDVVIGGETVTALRLRLGLVEGLVAGSYRARLIGYNNANLDGLVWQDKVAIKAIV